MLNTKPSYEGPDRRTEERPSKREKFILNIAALFDQSAWLLILPVIIMFLFVEPAKVKAIAQWTILATGLCGLALILSRILFPRIKVDGLIALARTGNVAAGIMIAGYMIFLGILISALCTWAKP